MSDAQLRDQAIAHLKQTTVAWAKYEQLRRAGKYPNGGNDTYWGRAFSALNAVQEPGNITLRNASGEELKATTVGYRNKHWTTPPAGTHWAKALEFISQIKITAPPPPPPNPGSKLQYGLCMAQNPLEALKARGPYKVWFTADPGYDGYATREAADACRHQGKEPFVWYVPTQVSRARAEEVARRLGTTTIIGQCETAEEFDASWDQGCRAVIGNLSPLREDQLAKVRSGEMVVVLEHYWNLQPHLQIDFKNLPVASVCVAVYDGGGEQPGAGWRPSLADYINNNRFPPGSGVYGPGMTDADWAVLPPCPG